MGNGANSRPENAVVMQRHAPPSNGFASQQPAFFANDGNTYDQRHALNYGTLAHHSDSSGLRNGWASQQSDGYGSSSNDYGYYATSGPSVTSNSSSYTRSHPRKNRHGKNRQESSHQSALSTHHHTRKAKPSEQARYYGNQGGYRNSWGDQGNASSNSDEIVFEVFHCLKTGRDYSVINVDGVRYLVNSWDAGTRFIYLFICLFIILFIFWVMFGLKETGSEELVG